MFVYLVFMVIYKSRDYWSSWTSAAGPQCCCPSAVEPPRVFLHHTFCSARADWDDNLEPLLVALSNYTSDRKEYAARNFLIISMHVHLLLSYIAWDFLKHRISLGEGSYDMMHCWCQHQPLHSTLLVKISVILHYLAALSSQSPKCSFSVLPFLFLQFPFSRNSPGAADGQSRSGLMGHHLMYACSKTHGKNVFFTCNAPTYYVRCVQYGISTFPLTWGW